MKKPTPQAKYSAKKQAEKKFLQALQAEEKILIQEMEDEKEASKKVELRRRGTERTRKCRARIQKAAEAKEPAKLVKRRAQESILCRKRRAIQRKSKEDDVTAASLSTSMQHPTKRLPVAPAMAPVFLLRDFRNPNGLTQLVGSGGGITLLAGGMSVGAASVSDHTAHLRQTATMTNEAVVDHSNGASALDNNGAYIENNLVANHVERLDDTKNPPPPQTIEIITVEPPGGHFYWALIDWLEQFVRAGMPP